MTSVLLYLLRSEPICQYRLWEGRSLESWPGATPANSRALSKETADEYLASFVPEAGTIHSLGGDAAVFEVQENSGVTFRLYDREHIDPKTGQGRRLQIEQVLACIDSAQGAIEPVIAEAESAHEQWFDCPRFRLWRLHGEAPFPAGAAGVSRVLMCIEGDIENNAADCGMAKGTVMLLPAAAGVCSFRPARQVASLEIGVPGHP